MNYLTERIGLWCRRAFDRARGKRDRSVDYTTIPEGARPKNALSKRTICYSSRLRRQGYMVYVQVQELSKHVDAHLTDERYVDLMNDYLKGVMWEPLLVRANFNHGKCKVLSIREPDVVTFMRAVSANTIVLQVLEERDVPATQENLDLLSAGLYFLDGSHCPVLYSRITY